jgi:hypothetical protein
MIRSVSGLRQQTLRFLQIVAVALLRLAEIGLLERIERAKVPPIIAGAGDDDDRGVEAMKS